MVEETLTDGARRPGLIVVLGGARSGKSRYAEELAARLAGAGQVIYVATATAYDDEMRARIAQHRAARPAAWITIEAPRNPAAALRAYLVASLAMVNNQRPPSATPLASRSSPVGEGRVGSASHLPSPSATPRFPRAILLDCLTLLTANLLTGEDATAENTPDELSVGVSHGAPDDDATLVDPEVAAASEARVLRAVDDLVAVAHEYAIPLIVVTNEVGMGLVPPYPLGRLYRDILGRANARLAAQADAVLLMLAGLPIELKALATAWQTQAQRLWGAQASE